MPSLTIRFLVKITEFTNIMLKSVISVKANENIICKLTERINKAIDKVQAQLFPKVVEYVYWI